MQDIYLSFTDEAEANSVLYTDDLPNYQNIDVIGTVYQPPTKPISMDEEYIPVPYPAPNFGVNIRLMDDEDIEPLKPFIIQPKHPVRVWA
jgi:hypothetical protein